MTYNSFLFIIPLTPKSHLTAIRTELQFSCFNALLDQTYQNWKALIIGVDKPKVADDERFIFIDKEAIKEEKLQIGTNYIREHNLRFDYIIRLDDDDIFNPTVLEKYKNSDADIIVDLNHWFIEWESKRCSDEFRPWFPNTCMHRFENALSPYGQLASEKVEKLNDIIVLLENDHSKIHDFYFDKNVCFENTTPIYLRVLSPDSITSSYSDSYKNYLKQFGNWNKKIPEEYSASKKTRHKTTSLLFSITGLKKLFYQKKQKKRFLSNFKQFKII